MITYNISHLVSQPAMIKQWFPGTAPLTETAVVVLHNGEKYFLLSLSQCLKSTVYFQFASRSMKWCNLFSLTKRRRVDRRQVRLVVDLQRVWSVVEFWLENRSGEGRGTIMAVVLKHILCLRSHTVALEKGSRLIYKSSQTVSASTSSLQTVTFQWIHPEDFRVWGEINRLHPLDRTDSAGLTVLC